MDHEAILRFLNHPRRTLFTWTATVVFGLFTVLPAWDRYSLSSMEAARLEDELTDITLSIASLPKLRGRVNHLEQEFAAGTQMVSSEEAERIREQVQRLAHSNHCQTRRLTLSDPLIRAWGKDDDPFKASPPADSDQAKYKLETRQLRLTADGSLAHLSRLLVSLTRLNRFAALTSMTVQSERGDGNLRLDVDISLFNLSEAND